MKTILCFLLVTLFAIPAAFGQQPAPKKTDSTFITEPDDLNVPKSAGQTINLKIKIDRVVGRTDGDGILQDDIGLLYQNGVLKERTVTLEISAYDVDRDYAEFPQCTPREFDRVKVNGHNIGDNGAEVFLDGTDKQWRKVSYKVPAEFIKFGKWMCDGNGENCSWQGEGINMIEIYATTHVKYIKVPILNKRIPTTVSFDKVLEVERPGNTINDFFVTVQSTRYTQSFAGATFLTQPLENRNHQLIADPDIARKVITKIKSAQ